MADGIDCRQTSSPVSNIGVSIWGNAGNDYLKGGRANDFLHCGPGNDQAEGNEGSDVIHAADGHEWNDRLSGGPGMDKAYVDTDGVGAYGEWITNDLNDDDGDGITNEWDIETIDPVFVLP